MNAKRLNHDYPNEGPRVEEVLNFDTTRFFELLKDYDESLWDRCTNHCKLSIIIQVFTINSNNGMSDASYDSIIECEKNNFT